MVAARRPMEVDRRAESQAHAVSNDDLTDLSATAAAGELARGAVGAEEYCRACLDRIAALDGKIKAFVHLDREHALAQARALAVTVTNVQAAIEIVRVAHEMRGDMTIVARARDADHATRLYEAGATDAIPETIEASLQLAETVLVDVGVPMGHVIASIHDKRDEYREILKPKAEEARERRFKRLSLRSRLLARRRAMKFNEAEEE